MDFTTGLSSAKSLRFAFTFIIFTVLGFVVLFQLEFIGEKVTHWKIFGAPMPFDLLIATSVSIATIGGLMIAWLQSRLAFYQSLQVEEIFLSTNADNARIIELLTKIAERPEPPTQLNWALFNLPAPKV